MVPSVFGLPDRIRTYDLKSRSLARYPAVPRVDIVAIISQAFEKVNSFSEKMFFRGKSLAGGEIL